MARAPGQPRRDPPRRFCPWPEAFVRRATLLVFVRSPADGKHRDGLAPICRGSNRGFPTGPAAWEAVIEGKHRGPTSRSANNNRSPALPRCTISPEAPRLFAQNLPSRSPFTEASARRPDTTAALAELGLEALIRRRGASLGAEPRHPPLRFDAGARATRGAASSRFHAPQ